MGQYITTNFKVFKIVNMQHLYYTFDSALKIEMARNDEEFIYF
jgi:hypothetical protein